MKSTRRLTSLNYYEFFTQIRDKYDDVVYGRFRERSDKIKACAKVVVNEIRNLGTCYAKEKLKR